MEARQEVAEMLGIGESRIDELLKVAHLDEKSKEPIRQQKIAGGMKNEVLCKILCHNICCVIMSQLELGIEVEFWGHATPQKTAEPTKPEVPGMATAVAKTWICSF